MFSNLFFYCFIIPVIFFLRSLQNILKIISPENRRMSPSTVWLILIPVFGVVWQFMVVSKIADSIKAEYTRFNILVNESRPTYTIGLVYCISYLLLLIPSAKVIGSFAVLVTWILYWIKVNECKNLLLANKDNFLLDAERQIFHTPS